MLNSSFHSFLKNLSFTDDDLSVGFADENTFEYEVDADAKLSVKYILTPTNEDIFNTHKLLWNKNSDNVFVAVSQQRSHIINVKEKPDASRPLKNSICLKTFDYGINTIGFEHVKPSEISKQYIDSALFFDFVSKNQRKGQEVDKDLLLNLLTLKNDLVNNGNEEVVHLLILRCIFIKYLEDRGIFENDYLLSILKTSEPANLVAAFDEIRKINGDVFKYDDFNLADLRPEYLKQLALFFESDYRSGQMFLFPYQFDQIPIQLISHVYEAFLKEDSKKRKGIYYTPPFLVKFMLSQVFTREDKVGTQKAKCLDPAVGSGAFLVECFSVIQKSYGRKLTFDEKKSILENQLFGIDIDRKALQIAAFSLYLALLETEDPNFIKDEIKHAHPILPSLIGKTLVNANAITDDIFPSLTFEYIVSNPPWGSVPKDDDVDDETEKEEIKKERLAIANKGKGFPEYCNVSDFERSQAFLMRFSKWTNAQSRIVAVVKNSIFLNDNALGFRGDLLNKYQLEKFYELSHYNKILFKKRVIGEINGNKIELGASEPCAVLVLSSFESLDNQLLYISPKLSDFAEKFELIQFSSRDIFDISQNDLIQNDQYWKVLVNGDKEDYDIIVNKLLTHNDIEIEARAGFQPKSNMVSLGDPIWKKKIEPQDFDQFSVVSAENLGSFNWNQTLHRKREESIFSGSRIIVPVRPLKADNFLFRGAYLTEEIVHKHNILSIKFKDNDEYVDDYLPYLAILNSQLIGFMFFHLSIQWGKGDGKRDTLRNIDIEKLPIKRIVDKEIKVKLNALVVQIQTIKASEGTFDKQSEEMNDIIFEHYGLLDYEKQVIKEFYQINVEREDKSKVLVKPKDINQYFETFKSTFSLILSEQNTLNATCDISVNMGAVICISIVAKHEEASFSSHTNRHILNFVKRGQLKKVEALKILEENKVKLYEDNKFYIIKSNQFKDWTVRQAIKDAREEIEEFIKHLAN